jgi:hypothetical protein
LNFLDKGVLLADKLAVLQGLAAGAYLRRCDRNFFIIACGVSGVYTVSTASGVPVNWARISTSASPPMARATFTALLNQLLFLSTARGLSHSSEGRPSDISIITGATKAEGACKNELRDSFALSSWKAAPKFVDPAAGRLLQVKVSTGAGPVGFCQRSPVGNSIENFPGV